MKRYLLLICVLLGFAVYFNSLGNRAFLTGDNSIVNVPLVQELRNTPLIFTRAILHYKSRYQPLSFAVVSLFRAISGGKSTIAWRILQITLHAAGAALLFLLIFLVFRQNLPAFIGSAIFAVHPLSAPVVNSVNSISFLLDAILLLSVSILVLLAVKRNKPVYYAFSLVLFICGLFNSDAVLFLLPAVLLIFLVLLVSGETRHYSLRILFLLVSFVYMVLFFNRYTSAIKLYPITYFPVDIFILKKYLTDLLAALRTIISFSGRFLWPYKNGPNCYPFEELMCIPLIIYSFLLAFLCYLGLKKIKKHKKVFTVIAVAVIAVYFSATIIENKRYLTDVSYWESLPVKQVRAQLANSYYEAGDYFNAKKHLLYLSHKGTIENKVYATSRLVETYHMAAENDMVFYYLLSIARIMIENEYLIEGEMRSLQQSWEGREAGLPVMTRKKVLCRMIFFNSFSKYFLDAKLYDWAECFLCFLCMYNPYDIDNLMNIARTMIYKGYYRSAEIYLKQVLRLVPEHAGARNKTEYINGILSGENTLAAVDAEKNEWNVSEEDKAIMNKLLLFYEGPDLPEIEKKAKYIIMNNVYEKIKDEYKNILRNDPGNGYFWRELRIKNDAEKECSELLKHFKDNNIKEPDFLLDPNTAITYYNISCAWYGISRNEDSVRCILKALNVKPDYVAARNMLGVCYSILGMYERALREFQTALKLNPGYTEARNNIKYLMSLVVPGQTGVIKRDKHNR